MTNPSFNKRLLFFFFRLSEFFFYPLLGRARFRGRCWAAIWLSRLCWPKRS